MKLPVLSRFGFNAKRTSVADRANILNWLGVGAPGPQTIAVAGEGPYTAALDASHSVNGVLDVGATDGTITLSITKQRAGQSGTITLVQGANAAVLAVNAAHVVYGAGDPATFDNNVADNGVAVIRWHATGPLPADVYYEYVDDGAA